MNVKFIFTVELGDKDLIVIAETIKDIKDALDPVDFPNVDKLGDIVNIGKLECFPSKWAKSLTEDPITVIGSSKRVGWYTTD